MDCQMLIFGYLDVTSLLALAQVNKYFHELAAVAFKWKYGRRTVEIMNQIENEYLMPNIDIFEDNPQKLVIEKLFVISKFFKYFGQMIKMVDISNFESRYKNISFDTIEVINKNSIGLESLKLNTHDENILDYVSQPFINVKHVVLNGVYRQLGSNSMNLNEIFPKLEELNLEMCKVNGEKSMEVKLPNLKRLKLSFNAKNCFQLIKQNQQIQRLTASAVSMNSLQILDQNLSNLTHLAIQFIIIFNSNVHFKNVKHLTINTYETEFAKYSTFDQLEELELIKLTLDLPEEWIEFIRKNANLKKLHVKLGHLVDNDYHLITENTENLVDVSFIAASNLNKTTIVTFLQRNKQLKTFHLTYFYEAEKLIEMFEELEVNICDEWNLSINKTSCLFERKQ